MADRGEVNSFVSMDEEVFSHLIDIDTYIKERTTTKQS
jgi:hypothetical protein